MDANGRSPQEQAARMLEAARGTFWDRLGCRIVQATAERVVIGLDASDDHLNHLGIVHGGVYASLLDQAMGIAASFARPDEAMVTTNLNVHYTAAAGAGTLQAEGRVLHASRRMLTAEARVTDGSGALCAWGSGTFRILSGGAPEGRDGA